MAIHERPRCWVCLETVEFDPIFSAICDHDHCPSAVFHGICLMEWREHREAQVRALRKWVNEHGQNE